MLKILTHCQQDRKTERDCKQEESRSVVVK